MAIRNVLQNGDPQLREISKTVTVFDSKLSEFVGDLFDTMRYENGVGLAAPQVGVLKRVCVITPGEGEESYVLINPTITKQKGRQMSLEGCLSVQGQRGRVVRPKRITVEYQDICGAKHTLEAEGYLATIFCHEIDHLSGVLFIDKLID